MGTCSGCGCTDQKTVNFYGKEYCQKCLEQFSVKPNICPICKTSVSGDDAVALLLTRATATPVERMAANTALVLVCPTCHGLFFDDFQYGLLAKLKG